MSPRVSFIVLSYNYAHYICKTIESIISQTVDNIEIIVIDDNSTDNSVEVVRSYKDPRVKLIENATNLGGSASFNKAFSFSSGDFIATVDSDDWIEPTKTEKQLILAQSLEADVVGTWVNVVDVAGNPHPHREAVEAIGNRALNYNLPSTWIVQNSLCRSSSLVRRRFHEEHGLADPQLTRTPDFELWLRALKAGGRIEVVEEKLTNYRLHERGVTHADPVGTYLEFAYIFRKHMIPVLDRSSDQISRIALFNWFLKAPQALDLTPRQRFRVLGFLSNCRSFEFYNEFREWIISTPNNNSDRLTEDVGKSIACFLRYGDRTALEDLQAYHLKVEEARDWFRGQSERWQEKYREAEKSLKEANRSLKEANRSLKKTSKENNKLEQQIREMELRSDVMYRLKRTVRKIPKLLTPR